MRIFVYRRVIRSLIIVIAIWLHHFEYGVESTRTDNNRQRRSGIVMIYANEVESRMTNRSKKANELTAIE